MENIQIFGIKISKISKKELFKKIDSFLSDKKQHYITTPNPEFLMQAGQDEEFFYVLNQSDINIPDGIGLKFAGWAMGERLERITGADLVKDILQIAIEKKYKVGIINWSKGLSNKEDISKGLQDHFRKLNFYIEDIDNRTEVDCNPSLQEMRLFSPDILFVTFGAPYQEKFIFHNLKNLPSVKLAMGVGASFDCISGKAKRAPKIFRSLGLEWLWRLFLILFKKNQDGSIHKIKRSKRIYNAVIKFPLRFIRWRFILPFLYRSNVACLMYKREENKYKIFIVKRSTEENHWQLPQGGIDREEDCEKAGVRELREEAGTDKFKSIKFYKNLWKYNFDKALGKYKTQRHTGYKGQRQSLFIAEFQGKDEDIKINFWDHDEWMWIDAERLVDKVFYMRKESSELYLQKFKETLGLNK